MPQNTLKPHKLMALVVPFKKMYRFRGCKAAHFQFFLPQKYMSGPGAERCWCLSTGTCRAPPSLPRDALFIQPNTCSSRGGWRPVSPTTFHSYFLWTKELKGSREGFQIDQNPWAFHLCRPLSKYNGQPSLWSKGSHLKGLQQLATLTWHQQFFSFEVGLCRREGTIPAPTGLNPLVWRPGLSLVKPVDQIDTVWLMQPFQPIFVTYWHYWLNSRNFLSPIDEGDSDKSNIKGY